MEQKAELKRTLSFTGVTFFGLSFMAPLTIFVTYGIAATSSGGMVATGYFFTSLVVLFSAFSYARLSKEFPITGSTYTYVNKTMGPNVGFLIGWTILLDYLLSPMVSSLLISILINAYFPSVSLPLTIILFLLLIVTINILGIKVAATYNTIIVLFQIIFILLFCGMSVYGLLHGKGAGTLVSITPFFDKSVSWIALLSTVPLLYFSFLGFDAVTTLSEETKNPEKVIPKAIFSVVIIGAFLMILTAYFMHLVFPDISLFTNPDAASVQIVQYIGGNLLSSLFLAATITASTASAVSSCGSASRIMYSMGREGILPKKIFGALSQKFLTPVYNIIIVGIVGCSAAFMSLTTATQLISFGVLFGFSFVNIAVIRYFFIVKKQRGKKAIIESLIIPILGAGITFSFFTFIGKTALVFGGTWMLIGFIYLLVLTKGFTKEIATIVENI